MLQDPVCLASTDPDVWEKVAKIKRDFIEHGRFPDDIGLIPKEIIQMWNCSKKFGIKWDHEAEIPRLSKNDLNSLLERKQLFIDVVKPFVEGFQNILESTGFDMSLCDETGVFLIPPTNDKPKIWKFVNIEPGDVWNEKYIGCSSHTLALKHKRPVQMIGPAHYLKALENTISSAAPIFNEYGDILGCIIIAQLKAVNSALIGHALGWATSMAFAVSSQFRVFRRDKRLRLMNSTLQATFAHVDNGYISIDESGYLININKRAARLLELAPGKKKTNIHSIFKNSLPIKIVLESGFPLLNCELQLSANENKTIIADIDPFHGERKQHADGAILKLARKSELKEVKRTPVTIDSILGESSEMLCLKETVELASEKPVNILLLGESGTGKEIFARAIHNYSKRSGPFVAINCASIPSTLIESELFGYEGGAFTGADKKGKKGKIEHANGGTLFLDEIGDMPIELQPALLRVLEEKRITRIGGNKSIPIDFRIISATNKPMRDNIHLNTFRQDLYFRLAVVSLEIPSLRKRGEDILLLADHIIRKTCERFELAYHELSSETKAILMAYDWPGNVRQLENAMVYAVTVAKDRVIIPEYLPKDIIVDKPSKTGPMFNTVKELEKDIIKKKIKEVGSVQQAAKELGIGRTTLYRKIKD